MNSVDILAMLQRKVGSAQWNQWQIHRWAFWDYVRLPVAGTNQLTLFAVAQGGSDPTSALLKTLEQTNMPKAGSFGQVYFVIQQIRTHISYLPRSRQNAAIQAVATNIWNESSAIQQLIAQLATQGVLNIKIGQKDYFDIERPFKVCPPGFGVQVEQWANSNTATGLSKWYQQSTNLDDVWQCTPPQMVEPEQTIQVTIDFPNGNTPTFTDLDADTTSPAIDIGVIFDGYIARPAQ